MIELNGLLLSFLFLYLGETGFKIWVEHLNISHSRKHLQKAPAGFEAYLDDSTLAKTCSYTAEKSRLGVFEEIVSGGALLIIILSGFLPMLVMFSNEMGLSTIPAGLLFFLVPGLIQFLLELPFNWYNTFVLEEKYGFNRSTLRLWILDLAKSGILSLLLFTFLFSILIMLISHSPQRWWLWGFCVLSAVQLLMAVLYPVLIAPIFNTFEPVHDGLLGDKIRKLMEDNGIRVKKILKMDAGLRSRHTNAYFTGIGKTKQIVLYDTLIASHTHDEILAVLAHEAGHFRQKHVLKQLSVFGSFSLGAFYVTWLFIQWPLLYSTFGFETPLPYVGLFLAGIFWQKAGFFLQPLYMALSRRFEREADAYAVNMLKEAGPLIKAMKRLSADNLSNLNPHPLYVWFHYSHPPTVQRVGSLENAGLQFEDREGDYLERPGA